MLRYFQCEGQFGKCSSDARLQFRCPSRGQLNSLWDNWSEGMKLRSS